MFCKSIINAINMQLIRTFSCPAAFHYSSFIIVIEVMQYLIFHLPSYPFYANSGNASYRPGDRHRSRNGFKFFDMIFVEYGTLWMKVDEEEFALSKNCLLIIPPSSSYTGSRICTEETYFHWLHFSTKEPYEIESQPSNIPKNATVMQKDDSFSVSVPMMQRFPDEIAARLLGFMAPLETLTIDYFSVSRRNSRAKMNLIERQSLFLELFNCIVMPQKMRSGNQLALNVMRYLNLNYAEEVSFADLAKQLGCSESHLIKVFRQEYDLPPGQMLLQIRLSHAQNSLRTEPDRSITTIAYESGFSSASYFCRQFRSHYNCTPQEYRREADESEGRSF